MEVALRKATMDDALIVLEWRNNVTTRENSFSQGIIDEEQHQRWFKKKLCDERCRMYMMIEAGCLLGHIRLDIIGEVGEISYMIAPSYRRRGYGKTILALLEKEIPVGVQVYLGLVKDDNTASRRCFLRNGYIELNGGALAAF